MPDFQAQIFDLQAELRNLHLAIQALPSQIITALNSTNLDYKKPQSLEILEHSFTHKDILEEDSNITCQNDQIPCEWQVGRLSAQLTTAYERIAALEKQLLSQRIARR